MNIKLSNLIEQLKKIESAREQVELVTSSGNLLNEKMANLLAQVNELVLSISNDFSGSVDSYAEELKQTCKTANKLIETDIKEYNKHKEILQNDIGHLNNKIDEFQIELSNSTTDEIRKISFDLNEQSKEQLIEVKTKLDKIINDNQKGIETINLAYKQASNESVELIDKKLGRLVVEYNNTLNRLKEASHNEIRDMLSGSVETLKPYINNIEDVSNSINENIKNVDKLILEIKELGLVEQLNSLNQSYKKIENVHNIILAHLTGLGTQTHSIEQNMKRQNKTLTDEISKANTIQSILIIIVLILLVLSNLL